jgi:hypothetical protein
MLQAIGTLDLVHASCLEAMEIAPSVFASRYDAKILATGQVNDLTAAKRCVK